jgi:hypothetical protein
LVVLARYGIFLTSSWLHLCLLRVNGSFPQ